MPSSGLKKKPPMDSPAQGARAGFEGAGIEWALSPKWVVESRTSFFPEPAKIYEVMIKVLEAYHVKEELKRLGYKWHSRSKSWYKIVNVKDLPRELEKLEAIGVVPLDDDVKKHVPDIIRDVLKYAVKRIARDEDYVIVEAEGYRFVLEPSRYLLSMLKKAASNPRKKQRLENKIKRLLESLSEFTDVEYDPATGRVIATYPNIPNEQ